VFRSDDVYGSEAREPRVSRGEGSYGGEWGIIARAARQARDELDASVQRGYIQPPGVVIGERLRGELRGRLEHGGRERKQRWREDPRRPGRHRGERRAGQLPVEEQCTRGAPFPLGIACDGDRVRREPGQRPGMPRRGCLLHPPREAWSRCIREKRAHRALFRAGFVLLVVRGRFKPRAARPVTPDQAARFGQDGVALLQKSEHSFTCGRQVEILRAGRSRVEYPGNLGIGGLCAAGDTEETTVGQGDQQALGSKPKGRAWRQRVGGCRRGGGAALHGRHSSSNSTSHLHPSGSHHWVSISSTVGWG
jgi:hypothetical protein